jgi:site-specific DNA-cytosine methylase
MYSRRGSKKGPDDPRYKCHEVALQCAEEGEYDVIFLENVVEYTMEEQCKRLVHYDWKIAKHVDPRRFGYPLSRPRQVAVGVRKSSMAWMSAVSLDDLLKDFEAEACNTSLTEFYFVLSAQEIQRLHGIWYDLSMPCSASLAPSFANAMQEYEQNEQFKKHELWDLSQVPSHGHASTSLADGSMMCLTTNTSYVYNHTLGRLLFPEEALNAMGIPVLDQAACNAGIDPFVLTDTAGQNVSYTAKVSLAGNGWLMRANCS